MIATTRPETAGPGLVLSRCDDATAPWGRTLARIARGAIVDGGAAMRHLDLALDGARVAADLMRRWREAGETGPVLEIDPRPFDADADIAEHLRAASQVRFHLERTPALMAPERAEAACVAPWRQAIEARFDMGAVCCTTSAAVADAVADIWGVSARQIHLMDAWEPSIRDAQWPVTAGDVVASGRRALVFAESWSLADDDRRAVCEELARRPDLEAVIVSDVVGSNLSVDEDVRLWEQAAAAAGVVDRLDPVGRLGQAGLDALAAACGLRSTLARTDADADPRALGSAVFADEPRAGGRSMDGSAFMAAWFA